jgi:hypothetical protein
VTGRGGEPHNALKDLFSGARKKEEEGHVEGRSVIVDWLYRGRECKNAHSARLQQTRIIKITIVPQMKEGWARGRN